MAPVSFTTTLFLHHFLWFQSRAICTLGPQATCPVVSWFLPLARCPAEVAQFHQQFYDLENALNYNMLLSPLFDVSFWNFRYLLAGLSHFKEVRQGSLFSKTKIRKKRPPSYPQFSPVTRICYLFMPSHQISYFSNWVFEWLIFFNCDSFRPSPLDGKHSFRTSNAHAKLVRSPWLQF